MVVGRLRLLCHRGRTGGFDEPCGAKARRTYACWCLMAPHRACACRFALVTHAACSACLQLKRQLPESTYKNALGGYREAAAEREPRTIVR